MAIALLDTNVLVYFVDPEDHKKQQRAEEVMNALRASQNGRLSVQNLAEFFYTCLLYTSWTASRSAAG